MKILSVIKLFAYWMVEKVGFPATTTGRILQRSNTTVLRAVACGEVSAKKYLFYYKLNRKKFYYLHISSMFCFVSALIVRSQFLK